MTDQEILENVRIVELETLDIRTRTLRVSLPDCAAPDVVGAASDALVSTATNLTNGLTIFM